MTDRLHSWPPPHLAVAAMEAVNTQGGTDMKLTMSEYVLVTLMVVVLSLFALGSLRNVVQNALDPVGAALHQAAAVEQARAAQEQARWK